jgi:RNA polymerase primary sigma factor
MKSKNVAVLSEELVQVVDGLVAKSDAAKGVLTEDDIQVAIKDIDIDGDELSELYDAIRERGVDITTSAAADVSDLTSGFDVSVGDYDDDDAEIDEVDEDGEERDLETLNEAKAVNEALRAAPKPKTKKRSSRARGRRSETTNIKMTRDPVRMYLK